MAGKYAIGALLGVLIAAQSQGTAAADRVVVHVGDPLPRFEKLKPRKRIYLRHRVSKDGLLEPVDVQIKEVRFEEEAGIRRVRIVQRWNGSKATLHLDSMFEDRTLRPITHQRDTHREGAVRREGFRFFDDKVVGITDQPENVRRDFELATEMPSFNFEIDLETLQTLPLRRGAEFQIAFYHPGGDPPALYKFIVSGEETLFLAGEPIDCWVVTTDYNQPTGLISKFWVAKGSQEVVRVHNPLPDGTSLVKTLLTSLKAEQRR